MTALVMMGLQMGVVAAGFVGMGKMFEWYHKDDSVTSSSRRGGSRNGRKTKRDEDFFF